MVSPPVHCAGIALCSAAGRAHQCRLSDLWAPRGDVSRSGSSDDKNDDAPLKYLAENLERQLLPVLGGVMMDRSSNYFSKVLSIKTLRRKYILG
jgi:hypothetical protein